MFEIYDRAHLLKKYFELNKNRLIKYNFVNFKMR
jgi:hypothetical protein